MPSPARIAAASFGCDTKGCRSLSLSKPVFPSGRTTTRSARCFLENITLEIPQLMVSHGFP
eukprot:3413529-Heterocapsa_arctica.AAC.1